MITDRPFPIEAHHTVILEIRYTVIIIARSDCLSDHLGHFCVPVKHTGIEEALKSLSFSVSDIRQSRHDVLLAQEQFDRMSVAGTPWWASLSVVLGPSRH